MDDMKNYLLIALWIAQIIIAIIFLQSLFFKFTGAPEAIYIFSQIVIEPWGRYAIGIAELIVAILLLVPATSKYGAIGALLIILPAILLHLTVLGVSVMEDKGLLFGLAITVAILSAFVIWARTRKS